MWKIIYSYIFIFSLLASLFLVSVFRHLAIKFKIIDLPQPQRKIHQTATPLLGGAAMYAAFILTIGLNLLILYFAFRQGMVPDFIHPHLTGIRSIAPQLSAILGTTFILVLMGIYDDIKGMSAFAKLGLEICLASIVFFSGIKISLFVNNQFVSWLLTVLWIVGISNAFNLLDNMDGLSSGTALISSMIFFLAAFFAQQFFVATILACFCGVLLGFLWFNFPPAKVFMGDAGSLFIGYTLSILTIISTYYTNSTPTVAPIVMPLLIMAVPIFDTLSVIWIRIKNKKSIFRADKNHLSHRLLKQGMSVKQTLFFIYLVNFSIGLGALLLRNLNPQGCYLILTQAVCMILIIALLEGNRQ
ncbi:MAG: undecaprenyl/decaprenyl-phosphate alpha-N-acetylglucosaminyl 1-phosphate transferase [Candidatus Omnitrophica bacterium]|nr:undecaprenyl/decaprenyl-phosphate alpha-N-acetylglucosaminyl 1-phosphate transferase [Candidatus Omnitrophota bacterium]